MPLLLIALMSVFVFMTTQAFFTDVNSSSENVFVSGSLSVAVTQDEVLTVENWRPGEEYALAFLVTNTGSMPLEVKGKLHGAWGQSYLDPEIVEIISFERNISGNWVTVNATGLTVDQEFYLSQDGTEATLQSLQAGESAEFRATIRLSEDTPDEYQNQMFATSLHIAGKQATAGSSWPAEY